MKHQDLAARDEHEPMDKRRSKVVSSPPGELIVSASATIPGAMTMNGKSVVATAITARPIISCAPPAREKLWLSTTFRRSVKPMPSTPNDVERDDEEVDRNRIHAGHSASVSDRTRKPQRYGSARQMR